MPTLRPDRVRPLEHHPGPYGARWDVGLDLHRVVRHVLPTLRDQLTGLRPFEFVWLPYSEDILASLPAYCTAGRDIWRAVMFIICWEVVESHLPHQVMRQFGLHQLVPDYRLAENNAVLHKFSRRGKKNQDWSLAHVHYIDAWTHRHGMVADGTAVDDTTYPSDDYFRWYRQRTVIYVSNPRRHPPIPEGFQGDSARVEYLVDAMSRIHYMALDSKAALEEQGRHHLRAIREFVADSLQHVGAARRLDVRPPPIPRDIPRHFDPRRAERAPRNVGGGQHGGGRRRRVQSPEYIPQTGAGASDMATDHFCGGSTMLIPQSQIMHPGTASRSPVAFQEPTPMTYLQHGTSSHPHGGLEQLETRTQDLHDQQEGHEAHTSQATPVVPNPPRRGARTRRRRECGTGGHLGGH